MASAPTGIHLTDKHQFIVQILICRWVRTNKMARLPQAFPSGEGGPRAVDEEIILRTARAVGARNFV